MYFLFKGASNNKWENQLYWWGELEIGITMILSMHKNLASTPVIGNWVLGYHSYFLIQPHNLEYCIQKAIHALVVYKKKVHKNYLDTFLDENGV